jgi:hypothetical protein
MQQFNHAIVYVPEQPGIGEGRFYDPTADALDVGVLRHDDPGALALVLDPETQRHRWIPIPYQPPAANLTAGAVKLKLSPDGAGEGTLTLSMRGQPGSRLRQAARNPSRLEQGMKSFVGNVFSGGTVNRQMLGDVTELDRAAEVTLDVRLPAYGRREGEELRLSIHPVWSSSRQFQLSERRFPLVFGAPNRDTWRSEIELPEGASVERLPPDLDVQAPCFTLEREMHVEENRLLVEQRFDSTCERIPPEQYAEHRRLAEEVARGLREEVVLKVPD